MYRRLSSSTSTLAAAVPAGPVSSVQAPSTLSIDTTAVQTVLPDKLTPVTQSTPPISQQPQAVVPGAVPCVQCPQWQAQLQRAQEVIAQLQSRLQERDLADQARVANFEEQKLRLEHSQHALSEAKELADTLRYASVLVSRIMRMRMPSSARVADLVYVCLLLFYAAAVVVCI